MDALVRVEGLAHELDALDRGLADLMEEPHRRIIDTELWDSIKARQVDALSACDAQFDVGTDRLSDLVICGSRGVITAELVGAVLAGVHQRLSTRCDHGRVEIEVDLVDARAGVAKLIRRIEEENDIRRG